MECELEERLTSEVTCVERRSVSWSDLLIDKAGVREFTRVGHDDLCRGEKRMSVLCTIEKMDEFSRSW